MKNIMMKDIMPVSMHVIDQVLANLLKKRMKTEQLNVRCGHSMTSMLLKVLKSVGHLVGPAEQMHYCITNFFPRAYHNVNEKRFFV